MKTNPKPENKNTFLFRMCMKVSHLTGCNSQTKVCKQADMSGDLTQTVTKGPNVAENATESEN